MVERVRYRALHWPGRKRRDPRTERQANPASARGPAAAVSAGANGRRRLDPRAMRGASGPNGRRRLDRSGRAARVAQAAASAGQADTRAQPIVIEQPACWVLAVPDLAEGRLSAQDRDMLGAARRLADAHDGAVVAIAFAACDEPLGRHGADRVVDWPLGADDGPEGRAARVAAAIEALAPRHACFPDNPLAGGDVLRRVAAARGDTPAVHVERVGDTDVVSRGDGNQSDYHREPPLLLAIDAEGADPVTGSPREGRALPLEIETPAASGCVRDLGRVAIDPNSVPLYEADFIVAAGNGVRDWESFHAVAELLGATEGASRVVCDAGDMPRERQVGISGTLVSPRCYLAFGISGASQHLQGIAEAEIVVAVDLASNTEMQKRADLAVVGDCQAIMSAIRAQLEVHDNAA